MNRLLSTSILLSSLLLIGSQNADADTKQNSAKSSKSISKSSDALLRGVGTKNTNSRFKVADKDDTRSTKGQIGRATMSLSVDAGKKGQSAQTEDKVSSAATTRSQILAKQKKSPHDDALAAMKAKASEISPKGKGRIRISYTIGMQGKPTNVMVLGYSNKVDDALADILEGWQMPRAMAGQMISTRVDMFPTTAKAKKKSKKRSRKRVASK